MNSPSEVALVAGFICGPHCDHRVLHAPGECETCDGFPTLQKAREMWGIAYTADPRPASELPANPCPAEAARGDAEGIHRWPGNAPQRSTT